VRRCADHARHVRDAIREHGISAETVTGDTPVPERDGILAAFKAGRLRCVTNANVLTTGFDAPGTDLIALLRPTKSVGLYVQMVGRGTRLAEGKDDCLVLDFAGNTARHGPIDTVDGRKKEKTEAGGDAPIKVCPECQTINHASARRCIECDHEFPPPVVKVAPRAASDALLSTQIQATWCDVTGITYACHDKAGSPIGCPRNCSKWTACSGSSSTTPPAARSARSPSWHSARPSAWWVPWPAGAIAPPPTCAATCTPSASRIAAAARITRAAARSGRSSGDRSRLCGCHRLAVAGGDR
jgi:Helicase conserved C-terminal domain